MPEWKTTITVNGVMGELPLFTKPDLFSATAHALELARVAGGTVEVVCMVQEPEPIIRRSPDGTEWRLEPNDDGSNAWIPA